MATVDFTLDDIRKLIREEIHSETPMIIEQALVLEREHTRAMVNDVVDTKVNSAVASVNEYMAEQFNSFWDNNLAPVLEDLQEDVTVIKEAVKDHSFRIARLEARARRAG